MSNTLSAYNPIFYAQEGLMALEKALGLAGRVYRGYDDAQSTREKGDTITVRVPGSFTAGDAPDSAQAVTASSISMSLDQHKEVKFYLTDKELAYTQQTIIDEHIRPAAYALADKVDTTLAALYKDVPWTSDWTSTATVADITAFRAGMFNNKVDLTNPSMLHCMVSGTIESELLALQAFSQNQGAGQAGVETQLTGHIGRRYGYEFFANQNTPTATSATVADVAGAINNASGYAAGIKSIAIDGVSSTAQFAAGDVVAITGHTQQYVITTTPSAASSGAVTLAIYGCPQVQGGGLESAVVDDQVVTITLSGGSGATKTQCLAFHRNAFALGVAKLPDFMDGQGIRVATILDPVTRLALRASTWAAGDTKRFYVSLDLLFGVKTLDGNKAWRVRD
jgi:hypothetical protein